MVRTLCIMTGQPTPHLMYPPPLGSKAWLGETNQYHYVMTWRFTWHVLRYSLGGKNEFFWATYAAPPSGGRMAVSFLGSKQKWRLVQDGPPKKSVINKAIYIYI